MAILIRRGIIPPIAVGGITWDNGVPPRDSTVTLSNGNLTMTGTASSHNGTRATRTTSQTKIYYEVRWDTAAFVIDVGWADSGPSFSNLELGQGSNSFRIDTSGAFMVNGSLTSGVIAALAQGDVLGIAWDSTNQLAWGRKNNLAWNTGVAGTQNPATGQGGISTSGMGAGPFYPASTVWSGDVGTAHFTTASFANSAPSGFSPP